MNQLEATTRDAKRYRIMRLMLCAPEEQRRDMHAVIAHLLDSHPTPEPQNVDRAMDLLLNTLKLV